MTATVRRLARQEIDNHVQQIKRAERKAQIEAVVTIVFSAAIAAGAFWYVAMRLW